LAVPIVALNAKNTQLGLVSLIAKPTFPAGQVRVHTSYSETDHARFLEAFSIGRISTGFHRLEVFAYGRLGELVAANTIRDPQFLVAAAGGVPIGQVRMLNSYSNMKQVRTFQSYSYEGRAYDFRLHMDSWGTARGDVNAPTSAAIV
jgi:hypothetical protein